MQAFLLFGTSRIPLPPRNLLPPAKVLAGGQPVNPCLQRHGILDLRRLLAAAPPAEVPVEVRRDVAGRLVLEPVLVLVLAETL
eukprot:8190299-Alexandrium_andersonii.AAC.1